MSDFVETTDMAFIGTIYGLGGYGDGPFGGINYPYGDETVPTTVWNEVAEVVTAFTETADETSGPWTEVTE